MMSTASSKPLFTTSEAWAEHVKFYSRVLDPRPPSLFDVPPAFAGETYQPEHDEKRLTGQLLAVFSALQDGREHTLAELRERCGGSEAGISARLRDLKKAEFGAHDVRKRRKEPGGGTFVYWLATACQDAPNE